MVLASCAVSRGIWNCLNKRGSNIVSEGYYVAIRKAHKGILTLVKPSFEDEDSYLWKAVCDIMQDSIIHQCLEVHLVESLGE